MYIPPNVLFVAVAVIMLIYGAILWMIVRAKVDPTEPTRQEYETRMVLQRMPSAPREGVAGQTGGTVTPLEAPGTGRYSPPPAEAPRETFNRGTSLAVELEITGCSDPQMWYAGLVGQRVPYSHQDMSTLDYISREPAGYINVVRSHEAKIVPKKSAS